MLARHLTNRTAQTYRTLADFDLRALKASDFFGIDEPGAKWLFPDQNSKNNFLRSFIELLATKVQVSTALGQ